MMAEPVTAVTDYLLAAAYLAGGWKLARKAHEEGQSSVRFAAAMFFATSVGAAAGGSYHVVGGQALWIATVVGLGMTAFFMQAAAAAVAVPGRIRWLILIGAALESAVLGSRAIAGDDFRYVIYNHGGAMLVTLGLFGWAHYRRRSRSARWIAAGVAVTAAASGVQASGFTLHRYFNHNDLYHVIQLGSAWLFYLGFRDVRDSRQD